MSSLPFHRPIQPRAESLTIIRFFAALMVFCDHYAADLLKSSPAFVRNLLDRGSAGVQLFFILSGFLMVIVYGSRPGTIQRREFYVNRVARIYPAYLFALLLSLQMAYSWVKSVGVAPGLNVPVYVISKFTMMDGWYLGRYEAKTAFNWMQQGWSLSSEVFFYALFPFLLPAVLVMRRMEAPLLALLSAAVVQIAIGLTSWLPVDTSYSPLVNLPVFLMGMATGKVMLDHGPFLVRFRSLRLAVVASAIVYQGLTPETQLPHWQFFLLHFFYALVIGALGLEFFEPKLRSPSTLKKVFMVLGEISFSFYLLQSAVSSWIALLLHKLHIRQIGAPESWSFFALSFVISNLAAWLMWRFYEGPARRWILQSSCKRLTELQLLKWIQRRFAR